MSDSVTDGGHVEGHLASELRYIANVVDSLVEAATEFRGDGLDGYSFVGNGAKDDEQFGGRLRRVRLVHRDFGDETSLPFHGFDFAVDLAGLLDSEEEFRGGVAEQVE